VQSLVGRGYGDDDFATVIELQAQSAGLHLISEDAVVSDGLEPAGAVAEALAHESPVHEDRELQHGTG
jgi:hypothetical protein